MLHRTVKYHPRKSSFLASLALTLATIVGVTQVHLPSANAAVSSNGDYMVEFDIGSELPTPTSPPKPVQNYIPVPTPVYDAKPKYTISATNDSFALQISQTIIDFGALTATNPVTRASDISFTTPFYGAQVIGYENRPLINTERITIPDTTCDTGTCSQTIPANWENDLTYGFGFRCESTSQEVCGRGFSDQNSFKQFSDSSAKESPQTILLNQQAKPSTTAKITYKVNISGTQPVGGYSNTVTYIAIPNF
jgi:hypothetical protein